MFLFYFQNNFRWLSTQRRDLGKAYNNKARRWLSNHFHKLRENKGKADWINPEIAAQLLAKWAADEK